MDFFWATGIEDTFVGHEGPGMRRLDEYELTNHYELWREDIELAARLGFTSMRYGIPWYRIETAPGEYDWSFCDAVIPYIIERGIEPIVDLVHYGTPLWMEQSFLAPDYPERVAGFARAFAKRFPDVRYYTPLNEPLVNAIFCGEIARWPPFRRGHDGFVAVLEATCRGIVETVRALQQVRSDVVCVHVDAFGRNLTTEPGLAEQVAIDDERSFAMLDLVSGRVHGGSLLHDYLAEGGMDEATFDWFREHAIDLDVIGLNYYPDLSVQRREMGADGSPRDVPVWGGGEVLAELVEQCWRRYGRPVFITETSCNEGSRGHDGSPLATRTDPYETATDSTLRSSWLAESLATVEALRARDVPVVGYTWWPLFDLIVWDYREGSEPVEQYIAPMGLAALRMGDDGVFRRDRLPVADEMAAAIAAATRPATAQLT